MAKLKPNGKQVNLAFSRPEDLRLLDFLEKQAYEARYSIGTFIIVALQRAFEGQIPEADTWNNPSLIVESPTVTYIENLPEPNAAPIPSPHVLTPELEESIRAKIAERTKKRTNARGTNSPTPPK